MAVLLSINGVTLTTFDRDTWFVQQETTGRSTAHLDVWGVTPAVHQVVVIGDGALTGASLLFRGRIASVQVARTKKNTGRVIYSVDCVDWSFDLDAVLVTQAWDATSATTIAKAIIDDWAPSG